MRESRTPIFFEDGKDQMHACRGMISAALCRVQYRFLCRWRGCGNIAVTVSVQHVTVRALKNGTGSSCKSVISLSCRPSECFFSGSRNGDGSCMLRGSGAVLDGTGQTGEIVFQKEASDMYLPKSVYFFVRNSRHRPSRPLRALLV